MKIAREFREFVSRGNVVDMAVGIVIGAAFGKIVTSFVDDILMPPVGLLLGGVDFSRLAIVLREGIGEEPDVVIAWGSFVQSLIDFLIIGLAIFFVVRTINRLRRKKEEAPPEPPTPSTEELLLTEIRDLLREKRA